MPTYFAAGNTAFDIRKPRKCFMSVHQFDADGQFNADDVFLAKQTSAPPHRYTYIHRHAHTHARMLIQHMDTCAYTRACTRSRACTHTHATSLCVCLPPPLSPHFPPLSIPPPFSLPPCSLSHAHMQIASQSPASSRPLWAAAGFTPYARVLRRDRRRGSPTLRT